MTRQLRGAICTLSDGSVVVPYKAVTTDTWRCVVIYWPEGIFQIGVVVDVAVAELLNGNPTYYKGTK